MRIHDKLDEILSQGPRIKILRLLFAEKDEHTGRAIAKAINMSASSTHTTLKAMEEERLVSVRKKGNAILYKLRESSYIVKELLMPLFEKEKKLYSHIISHIKKNILKQKKEIVSIAVFGSVAKKEETSKSDIDLLVITKTKLGKIKIDRIIDLLSIEMAKEFNISLSPYILTDVEIKERYNKKVPLIKSILDNNRLIYGIPIEKAVL